MRAAVRSAVDAAAVRCDEVCEVGDICGSTNWSQALIGVDTVVHAAGRAHVTKDRSQDPLAEYRRVNVEGTMRLAALAAASSVRRFIFVSSIKVNGESTLQGKPFSARDVPSPVDAYGRSKSEAESELWRLQSHKDMEVVVVRPPLVYGPGVKANFASLMRCIAWGIPLPLGAIDNRRSLVALDNVVHLLGTCITHPAAANQTLMVSDGEDLSTTELLRCVGRALGRPARLFPVPVRLLALGAGLIGKSGIAHRLCGSLQIDISGTRRVLGWSPPVSVQEGLRKTAEAFLREARV